MLLANILESNGDNINDLHFVFNEPFRDGLLDEPFDNDYGSPDAKPFLAYSENYVYFCSEYGGQEYVSCVGRDPGVSKPKYH